MTLIQAIQNIPDWKSKTAQELHSVLNVVQTEPDPTPYTFVSLGETLTARGFPGSDIRSKVSTTMLKIDKGEITLPQGHEDKRGDVAGAYIAMAATQEGLSLHIQERQQLVGLLAQLGQWPIGYMEAVISLGIRQFKLYECALSEVQTALAAIQLEDTKQTLAQAARDRYNAFVDALAAWNGAGNSPEL